MKLRNVMLAAAVAALALAPVALAQPNTLAVPPVAGPVAAPAPAAAANNPTLISWAAVFAGALAALGIHALLSIAGLAVGASQVNAYDRRNPVKGVPMTLGIWMLVSGLLSLFIGGWVGGKLSGATALTGATTTAGGMHGLLVWALATIGTLVLLGTAAGALVGGFFKLLGDGASAAASGVGAVAKGAAEVAPAVGSAVKDAVAENVPALNWDRVKREVRVLLRDTKENAKGAAKDAAEQAGVNTKDPLQGDEELGSVLTKLYGTVRDKVDNADRDELVDILASRTGKSKDEINKGVEKVEKTYQEAKKQFDEAVAVAEQKAREAADATAKATATAATWTFVALLVGLVVTTGGALLGVSNPTLFSFWG